MEAQTDPGQQHEAHDDPRPQRHVALPVRATLGVVAAVAVIAAGVGWLYVLKEAGVLGAGPDLRGALPLEQLAGQDAQPLLRLVVAWLPAGLAAGVVVAASHRAVAAAVAGLIAFVVLFVAGAASDALAQNDAVTGHLGDQLSRGGTWTAVGLVVIGAALVPRPRRSAGAAPAA